MTPITDDDRMIKMPSFKKLLFAPFFLISFAICTYLISGVLNIDSLFSFDLNSLLPLLYLIISVLFTSMFFVIFATLAQDMKFGIPVILISAIIPFVVLPLNLALVFGIGSLVIFNTFFFQITSKLKSYLTFSSQTLLFPSIKQIASLLIVIISFTYYLSLSAQIAEKGFEIPDSLIDTALNFSSPNPKVEFTKGDKYLAQITQEQKDFLKQNPDLLKSQGLDPAILDQATIITPKPAAKAGTKVQTKNTAATQVPLTTKDITKKLIKDQFDKILEPYKNYIAPTLALLFFVSVNSIAGLVSILFYPLLPFIFMILEKTNFIHFETEMREVKKLVV